MTVRLPSRWHLEVGRANARSFQFAGVQWEPLRTGVACWVGIGGVFVCYVSVWRDR